MVTLESHYTKITQGYLWNLFAKWVNRLIGIISSLVLVRVIEPIDFGIVGLVMIVLSFFTMLSDVGSEKYLIRKYSIQDEDLDRAWTINFLFKLIATILVFLFAGSAANLLQEPKLTHALYACCLIPLIASCKNIGLINFERDLNYKPIFHLTVIVKLIVFPITVSLALIFQSYWALISGMIITELLQTIGSYYLHQYRPKLLFTGWMKQLKFSGWYLSTVTTGFVRAKIDSLLIGRFIGSENVGIYRVSQEFAWVPFSELISPATSSIFSGMTQLRDKPIELMNLIYKYLWLSYLLIFPATTLMYILKVEIVAVLLGDKWHAAGNVIGWLSMLMLSMPLNAVIQSILVSKNNLKWLVLIDLIIIVTITLLFAMLATNEVVEVESFAQARVSVMLIFIGLLILCFKLVIKGSLIKLLTLLIAPALGTLVSAACILDLKIGTALNSFLQLILFSSVFIVLYAIILLVVIFVMQNKVEEFRATSHFIKTKLKI